MTSIKKKPPVDRNWRVSDQGVVLGYTEGERKVKKKKIQKGGETVWDLSQPVRELGEKSKRQFVKKNLERDFENSRVGGDEENEEKGKRLVDGDDMTVNFCRLEKMAESELQKTDFYVNKGVQTKKELLEDQRGFMFDDDSLDLSTTKIIDSTMLHKESIDTALQLRDPNKPKQSQPASRAQPQHQTNKRLSEDLKKDSRDSTLYYRQLSPEADQTNFRTNLSAKKKDTVNFVISNKKQHAKPPNAMYIGNNAGSSDLFNLKNSSMGKFDEFSSGEERSFNHPTEKKVNRVEYVKLSSRTDDGKSQIAELEASGEEIQFTNTFGVIGDSYVAYDPVVLTQREPNCNSSPLQFKKSPNKILGKRKSEKIEGVQNLLDAVVGPRKLDNYMVKREVFGSRRSSRSRSRGSRDRRR